MTASEMTNQPLQNALKGEKAATEHVQRLYEQVNPRGLHGDGPRHADKPRDEPPSATPWGLSYGHARGDDKRKPQLRNAWSKVYMARRRMWPWSQHGATATANKRRERTTPSSVQTCADQPEGHKVAIL